MVWPDGVGSSWNLGHCCETALNEKVDDVAFVRAMVEQLESDTCIDPKRVYATGCSNGGGMTYKVACEAADVIAAAAPVDIDCVVVPTNDPWGLFERSALP
ncbi:prolyl oligopeptidase family serine peptidase [Sorangium sp. So ce1000]|uniref:prolyl oligopeptidase family serine peptidase n=1 Tax=Sorangium sp. So ce1000 TaxID=3133325 RepID=UPI003F5EB54A